MTRSFRTELFSLRPKCSVVDIALCQEFIGYTSNTEVHDGFDIKLTHRSLLASSTNAVATVPCRVVYVCSVPLRADWRIILLFIFFRPCCIKIGGHFRPTPSASGSRPTRRRRPSVSTRASSQSASSRSTTWLSVTRTPRWSHSSSSHPERPRRARAATSTSFLIIRTQLSTPPIHTHARAHTHHAPTCAVWHALLCARAYRVDWCFQSDGRWCARFTSFVFWTWALFPGRIQVVVLGARLVQEPPERGRRCPAQGDPRPAVGRRPGR